MVNTRNHFQNLNTEQKISLATELYYLYHLPQAKIAEIMGISRPWVSKLLARAEEMNLVKVSVLTETSGVVQLEQALIQKYHIRNARVVKTLENMSSLRSCALAAAHYIISTIKPDDKIGICFGRTLAALTEVFDQVYFPHAMVVPMVGGLGDNTSIMSNYLAENLAQRLGCEYKHLHAPALLDEKIKKETFLNDTYIKEIFDIANHVDMALFSPGDLSPQSSLLRDKQISNEELADLISLGAVGDLFLNFIDKDGRLVPHNVHDRAITVDLEAVAKNARDKIAIAIGKAKVPVLHAALKGKWVDTLITDSATAGMLLQVEADTL